MTEISKEVHQSLRNIVAMAQELETHHHLESLEEKFKTWRNGEINARGLWNDIWEYLRGPSRELHGLYSNGSMGQIAASAIERGVLNKKDIPRDVLKFLEESNYLKDKT